MIFAANLSAGPIPTCSIPNHSERTNRSSSYHLLPKSSCVIDVKASETASTTHHGRRRCECIDLYKELVPYDESWSFQKSIVEKRKALMERNEDWCDTLIVLQHYPVYTLGTASSEDYLNFDIKDPPFEVHRTERGGEVTFHGPGQLVMYPIMNLRNHKMDLHWYLRALEEVVIRALSSAFSIKASRLEGLTGVWVGDQKLAAIGIRVSQWMTYHGLAVNVTTDLTPFRQIIPCGIRNRRVGSIKSVLREFDRCRALDMSQAQDYQLIDMAHDSLVKEFSEVFQLEILQYSPSSNVNHQC